MSFFRTIKHLLPNATAWRAAAGTRLRALLEGFAPAYDAAKTHVDEVYEDLDPARTRQLPLWEKQFALSGAGTEAQRRQAYAAAWAASGGQDPAYLQRILRAAGFDVYVHEWWASGPPWVARDPRDYTQQPRFGSHRCGRVQDRCGRPGITCDRFLANEVGYLVNRNLTQNAPPPVPSDPGKWPFFVYVGGPTFPNPAPIPSSRRSEFEALVLKLRPSQQWVVTIVQYIPDGYAPVMVDGAYLMVDGAFVLVEAET
jgi:hypothetical protein